MAYASLIIGIGFMGWAAAIVLQAMNAKPIYVTQIGWVVATGLGGLFVSALRFTGLL